jgi:hypothetical protein
MGLASEHPGELLEHDLDDLLSGIEGSADLDADGPLADPILEGPNHRQVNVGLQQGYPKLAEELFDVFGTEPTFAPDPF